MSVLVWRCPERAEKKLTLQANQVLVIGRSSASDITLDDDGISREHARLHVGSTTVEVEDLDSSNGTFLSGKRIKRAAWPPGVKLKIGDCTLELLGTPADDIASVPTQVLGARVKERAQKMQARTKNFITRHWRGEYSLARSIFLHTFLFSAVFAFIVANITEPVAAEASPNGRIVFATVILLASLLLLAWQVVGIFRSLRGAKKRGAWLISRILGWGLLALMVLGIPFTLYEYSVTWRALRAIETGEDSGGRTAYRFRVDQNVLYFEGEVVWPIVHDFAEQLRNNPQVDTIVLKSPGGDTTAGRRVADQLYARNFTTFVTEGCASACTLIFAGGKRRAVGEQGQLGFHATSVILMDPMMTRLMNSFTFRHDSLNAETYRRAGISEPFIERAINTPSTDLWVPPHQVLINEGVIHEVVQ